MPYPYSSIQAQSAFVRENNSNVLLLLTLFTFPLTFIHSSPSKDVPCVSPEHKDLRSVRFATTSHADKLAQREYQLSLKSQHQFVVATAMPNHGHPADAPLEHAVPPTKQNSGQLLVPTLASAKPPPPAAVGDTSTFLAQNSFATLLPQLKNDPGSQHAPASFLQLQNNGGDPTTANLLDQIMASLQQILSPKNSSSPPVVSEPSLLSLDQQQSQLMLSNFLGNPMLAMSSGTRPQAAGPPPPLLVPQHHQQLQEPISPNVLFALSSLIQQKQQQPSPPQQQCPSTTLPPDLASALLAAVLLQE